MDSETSDGGVNQDPAVDVPSGRSLGLKSDNGQEPGQALHKRTSMAMTNPAVHCSFYRADKFTCQDRVRHCVLSLPFQLSMYSLVVLDVTCIVLQLVLFSFYEEFRSAENFRVLCDVVYMTAVTMYVVEHGLLLFGCGWQNLLRIRWYRFDLAVVIIVLVSAVYRVLFMAAIITMMPDTVPMVVKVFAYTLRGFRFVRLAVQLTRVAKALQHSTSKNKYRYVELEENLDLDLTYIDDHLLAMSVPASGCIMSLYRNPLPDVVRFLELKHLNDFRVYNACPEQPYSDAPFRKIGGEVFCIPVQDHSPPTMDQLVEILTDMRNFWQQDDCASHAAEASQGKVMAVHCKAGKGRTGCICCAWLMYSQRTSSALTAMSHFARRRTDCRLGQELMGVETPSQQRYLSQLHQHLSVTSSWLSSPWPAPRCEMPPLELRSLELEEGLLEQPHHFKALRVLVQCGGSCEPEFVLETPSVDPSSASIHLGGVAVRGDVRISLFEERGPRFSAQRAAASATCLGHAKGIILSFAFHTAFIRKAPSGTGDLSLVDSEDKDLYLRFPVEELDIAHRRIKTGRHRASSGLVLRWVPSASTPALSASLSWHDLDCVEV